MNNTVKIDENFWGNRLRKRREHLKGMSWYEQMRALYYEMLLGHCIKCDKEINHSEFFDGKITCLENLLCDNCNTEHWRNQKRLEFSYDDSINAELHSDSTALNVIGLIGIIEEERIITDEKVKCLVEKIKIKCNGNNEICQLLNEIIKALPKLPKQERTKQ